MIGCLMAATLYAQTDNQYEAQKDSLRQRIAATEGQEKLEAWQELIAHIFYEEEEDADTVVHYLAAHEQACLDQQMPAGAARCRGNLITYYYSNELFDELFERANDDLRFIAAQQEWNSYFKAYKNVVMSYFYAGQKEKAIEEAKRCYELSKDIDAPQAKTWPLYTLGNVLLWSRRYEESEDYFRRCIDASGKEAACYDVKLYAYDGLAKAYNTGEKNEKLALLFPVWEADLRQIETTGMVTTSASWSNFYISTLNYYSLINAYDRLEAYCQEIEQRADIIVHRNVRNILLFARQQIAMSKGLYQQAFDYAQQLLDIRTSQQDVYGQYTSYRDMTLALGYLNRGADCEEAFLHTLELKDSIANTDFHAQLDELRTIYEVDRLTAEKERNRNYFLFALGGCCLLALALGIWIHLNRQITRKNRALARQIREQIEQQDARERELLARVSFLSGNNDNSGDFDDESDCPEARKDRLCIAIRDLMLREKVYRDKHVTRDQVVERLGTNKMLFTDAFQYCFNMSFSEYINSLRLKEAVQLLEDPAILIDTISERTGFGTVRTFQRQFRAQYNMSPKEYRNMMQAEAKA